MIELLLFIPVLLLTIGMIYVAFLVYSTIYHTIRFFFARLIIYALLAVFFVPVFYGCGLLLSLFFQ